MLRSDDWLADPACLPLPERPGPAAVSRRPFNLASLICVLRIRSLDSRVHSHLLRDLGGAGLTIHVPGLDHIRGQILACLALVSKNLSNLAGKSGKA